MNPIDLGVAGAVIRSYRNGDETSLARYADNRKVWINLRDAFPHPYTVADGARWIATATAMRPEVHFCLAIEDQAVGGIGFELKSDVYRRSADIGYWLGEPYWGKGIMTAAVKAMTEYAFATFDLCRLSAGIFAWNGASMRVLEKVGYACEAQVRKAAIKDGRTIDVYLYAMVR